MNKRLFAVLLCGLLLSGCRTSSEVKWNDFPGRDELSRQMKLYPGTPYRLQAKGIISWRGYDFSVLLAAELDPKADRLKIVGLNPASGILIFRLDNTHANDRWSPFRPGMQVVDIASNPPHSWHKRMTDRLLRPARYLRAWTVRTQYERINRKLSEALIEDFRRIFRLKKEKPLAAEPKMDYIDIRTDAAQWRLEQNAQVRISGDGWECEYTDSGRTVLYRNRDLDYTIRLTITKLAEKEKAR